MANSLVLHPIIIFVAANLLSTATAAFTDKGSALRYLAFLLSAGISGLSLYNFHDYINSTGWSARMLAGALFSVLLVFFDRLLYRGWAYGTDFLGPADTPAAERKKQSRWEFGSEVSGSTRCIGSEKEVANVPHFSQSDPKYVPSWLSFVGGHVGLILGLYYLNTFCIDVQLRANQTLLTEEYVPFFSRVFDVSTSEIATRVKISMAYWAAQYCILQLLHSLFSVIGVCTKPQELKEWRPIFGPITASYTVRGFWGKFWHQNIQLNLKGPAEFITHSVLHIPRGTLVARYSKVFFAFAVSGLMHVASDAGGAVPVAESGALSFFCSQAIGIMLEDGVQEIYRIIIGNRYNPLCRAIGYLWVIGFLSWSSPVWVYPVGRSMEREDMLLNPSAAYPLIASFFPS